MAERVVTARVINSDGSINDYYSDTENGLPQPDFYVVDDVSHVRRHLWLVSGQEPTSNLFKYDVIR